MGKGLEGGHLGYVTQLIFYIFSFEFSQKFSYELWFQIILQFLRKKLKSEWPLAKVKEWPWPLVLI